MPLPRKANRAPRARRPADSASLKRARRVLAIEIAALQAVRERLDARFDRAVDLIAACRGKVIVTGIGKSGLICRKIAATLASTGTPATFLHAAEAVHGDFGVVGKGDVVLAISYSGEVEEVVRLLPMFKRHDLTVIAVTGTPTSTLAHAADVVLDASVPEEACPLGLAPTASTTAALALGDALAVALLERNGFGENDFGALHPAGSLGRRLLTVAELMHHGAELPLVRADTPMAETVLEISEKRLGVTGVVDAHGELIGVVTDGDLRRGLQRSSEPQRLSARELMTADPKTIEPGALAARALAEMERHSITSLFVLTPATRQPMGVVHLHDILKAGVA
ncbi:MAG TPA: KpsF/GutQ family sugar-phosphate isomerase [Candidatus Dormibacteraeota bacterium]|nr:KpsF/GutQ family sugar-phosphate isomerase [Candidatus Dormibacteraeota bacterium]